MATDRSKVVHALIKSSGPVVNVRQLAKNICNMATEIVKGIILFVLWNLHLKYQAINNKILLFFKMNWLRCQRKK